MLGRKVAERLKDMLLNLIGFDSRLALLEWDDLGSVIRVVDRVVNGDGDFEAAFVGNRNTCNTSPHRLCKV